MANFIILTDYFKQNFEPLTLSKPSIYLTENPSRNDSIHMTTVCPNNMKNADKNIWTGSNGFVRNHSVTMLQQGCDVLNGKQFTVAAFGFSPYVIFSNNFTKMQGVDADIMDILAEHFNFTYQFYITIDGWGFPVNGSWNGLIGAVTFFSRSSVKAEIIFLISGFEKRCRFWNWTSGN